jgi:hypothetical protein
VDERILIAALYGGNWRSISERRFRGACLRAGRLRLPANAPNSGSGDVSGHAGGRKPQRRDCGMERYRQHGNIRYGFADQQLPVSSWANATVDFAKSVNLLCQEHHWRIEYGDRTLQWVCQLS